MSREISSLEITPKVIDLGSSIVPLTAVARAGVVVQHPLQSTGSRLLGLAGVLLAFEASPFGSGFRLPPKPSMLLWAICVVAALGVFMLAYARRRLVISTVAGETITLPPADAQFAAAVTNCIREAVEQTGAGTVHYRIDLSQRTIASVPPSALTPASVHHAGEAAHAAPSGVPVQGNAGHQTGTHPPATGAAAFALPPANGNTAPPYQSPAGLPGLAHGVTFAREGTGASNGQSPGSPHGVHGRSNGAHPYRNGGAEAAGLDGELARRLDSLAAQAQQGAPHSSFSGPPTGTHGLPGSAPTGAQPASGLSGMQGRPVAAPASLTLSPPDNGLGDLLALIRIVERADVQHKQALLDLLRVVESWRKGAGTSREDAMAHWQSFADYVQQYLGSIDGLPEATQRASRGLVTEPGLRM